MENSEETLKETKEICRCEFKAPYDCDVKLIQGGVYSTYGVVQVGTQYQLKKDERWVSVGPFEVTYMRTL